MGPKWGPPGSCGLHMGPMLALWTLLSGGGHLDLRNGRGQVTHVCVNKLCHHWLRWWIIDCYVFSPGSKLQSKFDKRHIFIHKYELQKRRLQNGNHFVAVSVRQLLRIGWESISITSICLSKCGLIKQCDENYVVADIHLIKRLYMDTHTFTLILSLRILECLPTTGELIVFSTHN